MKLYFSRGACSLTVRIILHELGLKSEYEAVDLKTKKTATGEDFFKINPKGSVPTVVLDNQQVLTENAVIIQYLAETNKATHLLPPTSDFKYYRVLEWLNYITTELHKGFSPLYNPMYSEETKNTIIIPILKKKFDFLDQHLSRNKFLAGDDFTLPDAYLFVMLLWAHHMKIDLGTHISNYYNELRKRKSIHEALVEESLAK